MATEQLYILVPHIGLVRAALALRQMQHVRLLDLVEQLVHLLFAVARGFAHDHVGKIRKGAFVGQREAVRRLDERAQIRGQHRFCRRNGLVRHAAQRHRRRARRIHDLKRRVGAQKADELAARLLVVLHFNKRRLALVVEFLKRARQFDFCHAILLPSMSPVYILLPRGSYFFSPNATSAAPMAPAKRAFGAVRTLRPSTAERRCTI